jgi:hypothetical protein
MAACLAMLEDTKSLLLDNASAQVCLNLPVASRMDTARTTTVCWLTSQSFAVILWQRSEQQMTYIYPETHKR